MLLDTTALLGRLIHMEEHLQVVLERVVKHALLEHILLPWPQHHHLHVKLVPREHILLQVRPHVQNALEEHLLLLWVQHHLLHAQPALLENMLQRVQLHV